MYRVHVFYSCSAMIGIILMVFKMNKFKLNKYLIFILICISFFEKQNVLLQYTHCPDCFGNELCDSLENGEIQLHWLSRFNLILHPKLTKSVFLATINSSTNIVLKSMTRRAQLEVQSSNFKLLHETFNKVISENRLKDNNHIQNVILCRNVKSLYLIFRSVDENVLNLVNKRNLWFDIRISVEPLLLKFLEPVPGMPVPRLIGTCGDIIAVEFKGKALNNFYGYDWMTRAFLSAQLLKMAEVFTFLHPSLIFYFTDISSDNIVVDSFGKIFLTDLDNVIIAERTDRRHGDPAESCSVHVSAVLDPIKLSFSPSDICKCSISDHNYYTVCRNMLLFSEEIGEGLLSNIPQDLEKYQPLKEILNECAMPKKYMNRITPGRLLAEFLNEIIIDFKWQEDS